MDLFNVTGLDVQAHHPEVLQSRPEGRAVAIHLPAGEQLQDHEVHERAWLVVLSGSVRVSADGRAETAGPGTLAVFDPRERHEVEATDDARLLLVLAPWPGDGHPGTRG